MNREGLFKRRGSPHWQIRYADENGRIVRASTGTTSKKLAREILAKRKTLVAEGRHLDVRRESRLSFGELCDKYWTLWGRHKRMNGLEGMLRSWKAHFGDLLVKDLSPERIEAYLGRRMDEGSSASTRNRHLTMLKAMLNKAVAWELLPENPAAKIGTLREHGRRTRFLDEEEIERLLQACADGFRPIVLTALHSGMRRGEILNLRWGDVNLQARILTVQRSKSGKKRNIPLDDTLFQTLRELPSRFAKGCVFPSPTNADEPVQEIKRQIRNAFRRAGLEGVRFHDLRHTFASHLVMNGVDLKTVQELLGHASLTTTQRYAHLAPAHRTKAVKVLDAVFASGTKTDTVEKSRRAESS